MARLLQLISVLIALMMSIIYGGTDPAGDDVPFLTSILEQEHREQVLATPTPLPPAVVVPTARHAYGPWPALNAVAEPIHTGYGAAQTIHLGFDVEGTAAYLEDLLAVLDKHNVKTTMFIVGSWAEQYPGWIQRFADDGHELANHTYSHSNMRDMSAEQVLAEIQQTEEIVQRLTGQSTKPWLRPPFGSRSEESIRLAYEAGWSTVIWSGSSNDWQEEATATDMLETMLTSSYPGAILYSHTYRADIPQMVDHFISRMHQRGFALVPMSVLMSDNAGAYLR